MPTHYLSSSKADYAKAYIRLMNKYPAVSDLRNKALKRLPYVSQAYLETGTDDEVGLQRNISAFQNISFQPRFGKGDLQPKFDVELFGQNYNVPFGIAPIGLTGLMWPKIELILAHTAHTCDLPFCLSTMATRTPEEVAPFVGNNGWFQLYAPRKKDLTKDLLDRAKNSGFKNLIITVDIPYPSRRQRTKRAGLEMPPRITPRFIWQALKNPSWTVATLQAGLPRLKTVEPYSEVRDMVAVTAFVENHVGGNLDWDYMAFIKDYWKGPVLIKGIMHEADAERAVTVGVDGIVVSNHGARQFDGAPASIDVLPGIVKAVAGQTKIILDSGIRTGLDILKGLALGADFVLLGRAYLYGVAALGKVGGFHTTEILKAEFINAMMQLGVESIEEIKALKSFNRDNMI